MVYFVQAGPEGSIKVGSSVAVQQRIKQLQTGNPKELILLTSIPGDKSREKEIHKKLSNFREKGEWYHPVSEVFQFIRSLQEVEYEVIGQRAYAVLRRDTEKSMTDHCPFCGLRHWHGKGDGIRSAHCDGSRAREELHVKNITLQRCGGYSLRTRDRHH